MNAYDISLFLYNIALIPVVFFSVLFLIFTLVSVFTSTKKENEKKLTNFPFVSVQVPTFNDPIAKRCVEKCMQFDYPKNRYEIIIADDSTNIETQTMMAEYAQNNPQFIKYIHRTNRDGFKPGALKNAMKITKGEIIVVFDSDWIPQRNFLKEIVEPFSDRKVAIVQGRQGFYNHRTNIITKFAAYLLMIYHTIVMPINNKINCVFFCGTAGAIRRSAFDRVGGWNTKSITEDSELSVKLLMKGYKTVYIDHETPSEVPDTFESFIKQQMRWCYGNTRVFFDNAHNIFFKRGLKFRQRVMISYITLANISAVAVVLMSLFGSAGWFLGEPRLFTWTDLYTLISRIIITGGFAFAGLVTLYKRKKLHEFWDFIFAAFFMGLLIAFSNSTAFLRASFNQKLHWFCTPKCENKSVLK